MTKQDIERAVEAYRWACPNNSILIHLDGIREVCECFAFDGKERNYRCEGNVCPRLRKFINILKEPEQ